MKTENFESFIFQIEDCSPCLVKAETNPIDQMIKHGIIKDKEELKSISHDMIPNANKYLDGYSDGKKFMHVTFNQSTSPKEFQHQMDVLLDYMTREMQENLLTCTTKREQLLYLSDNRNQLEKCNEEFYFDPANKKDIHRDCFMSVEVDQNGNIPEGYPEKVYYDRDEFMAYLWIQKISIVKAYYKILELEQIVLNSDEIKYDFSDMTSPE